MSIGSNETIYTIPPKNTLASGGSGMAKSARLSVICIVLTKESNWFKLVFIIKLTIRCTERTPYTYTKATSVDVRAISPAFFEAN